MTWAGRSSSRKFFSGKTSKSINMQPNRFILEKQAIYFLYFFSNLRKSKNIKNQMITLNALSEWDYQYFTMDKVFYTTNINYVGFLYIEFDLKWRNIKFIPN